MFIKQTHKNRLLVIDDFLDAKKKELQKSFKTKIRINVLSDKAIHKTKVQLRICGVR